jgi:hypothetical protein
LAVLAQSPLAEPVQVLAAVADGVAASETHTKSAVANDMDLGFMIRETDWYGFGFGGLEHGG